MSLTAAGTIRTDAPWDSARNISTMLVSKVKAAALKITSYLVMLSASLEGKTKQNKTLF